MEEKKENLVKKVCKEYNLSQIELSNKLDIPRGTLSRWVSTQEIPKMAKLALNLMLKNKKLENKLENFKNFKNALNEL